MGQKWPKTAFSRFSATCYLVENLKCLLLPTPGGHVCDLNEPWNTPIRSESEAHSRSEVPKNGSKGPKLAFRQFRLHVTPHSNETRWNEVEHRWGHPDWQVWAICQIQNVTNVTPWRPKCGPNRGKISFWLLKSAMMAYFGFLVGGTGLENNKGHHDIPVGTYFPDQKVQITMRGSKGGPNRLKMAFWPLKPARRAYFGMERVEQGWKTTGDIRTDQMEPFFSAKKSKCDPP